MATELDYMEYANDAAAQAAYVSSDTTVETFGKTDKGGTESGIAGDYIHAVKFTSGRAGTLASISVYIKHSADANVKCAIYDSSLNLLTNGVTEQKAVTAGQDGFLSFNFETPPTVAASTVYWIATYQNAQILGYYAAGSSNQRCYDAKTYNTFRDPLEPDAYLDEEWSMYASYDKPNLQCYSEDTIKEQGSYSLKGVAVVTDSLNDTLTRTVDPTIDLSGLGEIKFDIYASRTGSNIKIGIHDSGGTTTEHTPNIASANVNQTETWNLSAVSNANRDAIDSIIITIVNADADNTFYIDNMYGQAFGINVHDCTDLNEKVGG